MKGLCRRDLLAQEMECEMVGLQLLISPFSLPPPVAAHGTSLGSALTEEVETESSRSTRALPFHQGSVLFLCKMPRDPLEC